MKHFSIYVLNINGQLNFVKTTLLNRTQMYTRKFVDTILYIYLLFKNVSNFDFDSKKKKCGYTGLLGNTFISIYLF